MGTPDSAHLNLSHGSQDVDAIGFADGVAAHLRRRGLIPPGVEVTVRLLGGGVSCDVAEASFHDHHYVLKRPRGKLAVADDWFADESRIIAEADALAIAGAIVPDGVPSVVDLDEATKTLVMSRAPHDFRNWRGDLLNGRTEIEVGSRLGEMLSHWHHYPIQPAIERQLENGDRFLQLRIEPFHRVVAKRHQILAPHIERIVEQLQTRKLALVHGDFSPKNVLVGSGRVWVLDWEVAHVGDPIFDVAFLTTHLILKALHRPREAVAYRAVFDAFIQSYGDFGSQRDLNQNVGCLLLARVDGKSPATYLTQEAQAKTRTLGTVLLIEPESSADRFWADGE
jgi:aminoglycoside phosphotransferase (APT) family kinase protein